MNLQSRRIYLKNAFNVRDIGGYGTRDGGLVKWNLLFRADGLSALDGADWQLLRERNIKTILDLRSLSETKTLGYAVPEDMTYAHCPLQREDIDVRDPLAGARNAFGRSLTQGYLGMVGENTDLLAAALAQVTQGLERGAVLFHCTAGKDRTGVLAAVILYLLGVYDEDIVADYQVSYTYNKKGVNLLLKDMPQMEKIRPFLYSAPETMETLLDYFKEVDMEGILKENGYTEEKTELLRRSAISG